MPEWLRPALLQPLHTDPGHAQLSHHHGSFYGAVEDHGMAVTLAPCRPHDRRPRGAPLVDERPHGGGTDERTVDECHEDGVDIGAVHGVEPSDERRELPHRDLHRDGDRLPDVRGVLPRDVGVEEGNDAAVIPQARRVHARFAELGPLGIRAGVGVVDTDRQRAVFHQRLGEGFGAACVSLQDDRDPHQALLTSLRPASLCSR